MCAQSNINFQQENTGNLHLRLTKCDPALFNKQWSEDCFGEKEGFIPFPRNNSLNICGFDIDVNGAILTKDTICISQLIYVSQIINKLVCRNCSDLNIKI